MARKKKTAQAPATAPTTGVRVIAQQGFDGYSYGREFRMPKGAKLDKAIADGKVRIDDRMPGERVPPESADDVISPAPAEGGTA